MALRDLLPPGTCVVGGDVDDPRWAALVPPDEAALVAGRPPARQVEFVAGRACAREALRALGRSDAAVIGIGTDRGPVWPTGVVGAITHGCGEVAAVVADAGEWLGLGIDVEAAAPLEAGLVGLVCVAAERRTADACGLGERGPAVLFAVKEAVYKAWAPTGGWLEHADVRVELHRDGSLGARVVGSGVTLAGAWEVDGSVVRAAAWLPAAR